MYSRACLGRSATVVRDLARPNRNDMVAKVGDRQLRSSSYVLGSSVYESTWPREDGTEVVQYTGTTELTPW